MGNRGILHDESRHVVRQWAGKSWVTCELEFKGTRREVFGKGTYSELFFLDEATAFAAGHRPCGHCRRPRYSEFKAAWLLANRAHGVLADIPIAEIDKALHAERAGRGGEKATYRAALDELPAGTMFEHEGAAFLIWMGGVYQWSFCGYTAGSLVCWPERVNVLTPQSIVRLFYQTPFIPRVHESIRA